MSAIYVPKENRPFILTMWDVNLYKARGLQWHDAFILTMWDVKLTAEKVDPSFDTPPY